MRFVLMHLLICWQAIAALEVSEETNLPWNATELPFNETEESTGFLSDSETALAEREENTEDVKNIGLEDLKGGKRKHEEILGDRACGTPPFVENTVPFDSRQNSFPVGSVVTYTCEFGYVASGSKRSTNCHVSSATQQAEWTAVQLKCSPRSCGDPGYVPDGRVVGSLFTFPHNVTIECDEGYERRGHMSRICQANGEWSGSLATCQRIRCPIPASPLNGRTIFSSEDYGSELRYECQNGFRLDRKEQRMCDKTGKWSGIEPICTEMFCDPPVAPDHGSMQILDEGLKPGSLVLYACDEGRTLVGSARSTCSADGEWIFPAPRCVGKYIYIPTDSGF
ncbi:protein lev-9-like [Uloborus diversus]|uniref:protein lev-9-like n=1 Tax=Uloborus diversus TaxID=327109 RepID=UPI002409E216|nr:protein lev-9-like [Uloborus diversus]